MPQRLVWDQIGQKLYETGVDRGVLYPQVIDPSTKAVSYPKGVAWDGLTAVNDNPSGGESNKQYADNQVYLNLISAEDYAATIEAFTYPDEFEECDGSKEVAPGVYISQQNRKGFGFSYRSLIGSDTEGTDYGYKLHLIYGAMATPSEKSHATVNESPEASTLSWEVSTTPIAIENAKPSATIVIDSTKVDAAKLTAFEDIIYGSSAADARLPLPDEVIAFFTPANTQPAPNSNF